VARRRGIFGQSPERCHFLVIARIQPLPPEAALNDLDHGLLVALGDRCWPSCFILTTRLLDHFLVLHLGTPGALRGALLRDGQQVISPISSALLKLFAWRLLLGRRLSFAAGGLHFLLSCERVPVLILDGCP
jgi:hypothetical protein